MSDASTPVPPAPASTPVTQEDVSKATHTPATTNVFLRVIDALARVPEQIKHDERAVVAFLKKVI